MDYGKKKLSLNTNKNTSVTILVPLKAMLVVQRIHTVIHHTLLTVKMANFYSHLKKTLLPQV